MMGDAVEKWNRIYRQSRIGDSLPLDVLAENDFLLPPSGTALDLACGLGASAVFLAERGLSVTALDQSSVAIEKLGYYAQTHRLSIDARRQEVDRFSLPKSAYDIIVVGRFLDRSLTDAIIEALNPEGLLFYQTFTREKTAEFGPGNPDYLLAENELLSLFAPLRIIFYRENGLIGDRQYGLRNEAQFIGQKNNPLVTP